jgi:thiamine kinase-like enzyme
MDDLRVDVRSPHAADQVRALIVAAHWEGVPAGDVAVATISGGITNALYKVTVPSQPDRPPMLVRVYGEKTELLIDRAKDNAVVAALADKGIGVPFHGTFANGRIEGYLAARPLEPAEMGWRAPVDLVHRIAVETARLHGLTGMPGSPAEPVLWPLLDKWYAAAAGAGFPPGSAKAAALASLGLPSVGACLAWLKAHLPSPANGHGQALLEQRARELAATAAVVGGSSGGGGSGAAATRSAVAALVGALTVPAAPAGDAVAQARLDAAAVAFSVVFAHNDLLSGNVLLSGPEHEEGEGSVGSPTVAPDRVQLIDYEYAGWNHCGFDAANHFCEHCGFDWVLPQYPARETQYAWFRSYLRTRGLAGGVPTAATYAGGGGRAAAAAGPGAPDEAQQQQEAAAEDAVSAAFLDELYTWTNRFAPLSDAWWGLWAVLQAVHSPIDFDFMSYAVRRLGTLPAHMAEFWGPSAAAAALGTAGSSGGGKAQS